MRRVIRVLAALVGVLMTGAVHAEAPDIPSAYVVAAEDNGIPPAVLYAVAMTESQMSLGHAVRPWPWTLNVGGKGYRYDTRDDACAALRAFLKQTRVVDVGIAQMNVRWQTQVFAPGKRFADPCAGLDPYANLDEAAAVIRQHYDIAGDWVAAAGRYHRPAGGAPAARYRVKVSEQLDRLGASPSLGERTPALMAARKAPDPPPATPAVPANPTASTSTSSENITWVTPSPRTLEAGVAWVTPAPRRWMAETAVASR
nr:transglycosylase SLT domain-containing protein [uncultured Halomonas sp.]